MILNVYEVSFKVMPIKVVNIRPLYGPVPAGFWESTINYVALTKLDILIPKNDRTIKVRERLANYCLVVRSQFIEFSSRG